MFLPTYKIKQDLCEKIKHMKIPKIIEPSVTKSLIYPENCCLYGQTDSYNEYHGIDPLLYYKFGQYYRNTDDNDDNDENEVRPYDDDDVIDDDDDFIRFYNNIMAIERQLVDEYYVVYSATTMDWLFYSYFLTLIKHLKSGTDIYTNPLLRIQNDSWEHKGNLMTSISDVLKQFNDYIKNKQVDSTNKYYANTPNYTHQIGGTITTSFPPPPPPTTTDTIPTTLPQFPPIPPIPPLPQFIQPPTTTDTLPQCQPSIIRPPTTTNNLDSLDYVTEHMTSVNLSLTGGYGGISGESTLHYFKSGSTNSEDIALNKISDYIDSTNMAQQQKQAYKVKIQTCYTNFIRNIDYKNTFNAFMNTTNDKSVVMQILIKKECIDECILITTPYGNPLPIEASLYLKLMQERKYDKLVNMLNNAYEMTNDKFVIDGERTKELMQTYSIDTGSIFGVQGRLFNINQKVYSEKGNVIINKFTNSGFNSETKMNELFNILLEFTIDCGGQTPEKSSDGLCNIS
jgi:hypothetical protein